MSRNPFVGNLPVKNMTREEEVRAIRLDIVAEEEAISTYTAHADATSTPGVKKVLMDIAREEKVHVGELQELLVLLTEGTNFAERETLQEGRNEVDDLLRGEGLFPKGGIVGRQIEGGRWRHQCR